MGLDTSHDCWHGPYSSFMQFRRAIAVAVGIPLDFMDGFEEQTKSRVSDIPVLSQQLPIRWDSLKPDALHKLLNHSDCDGQIEVADLIPIAERLEAVGPTLPDAGIDFPEFYRDRAAKFAKGLRNAWSLNEPVIFR